MLSEKLKKVKGVDITNEKFVFVDVDDYITISVVENGSINTKFKMKVFKESNLISSFEQTIFDTKLEDIYNHYETVLKNVDFNLKGLLESRRLNDYVAQKIITKVIKITVDILNEQFCGFETLVFNVNKLKYHKEIIEAVNERLQTRKLFYL